MGLLEVVVAMVVSAMLAGSITALALTPIKTQRQKSNYTTAEAAAIAIRKGVVNDAVTFSKDTDITDAKVKAQSFYTSLNLGSDASCTVKTAYNPPGTTVVVPYAVECIQGNNTDPSQAQAWQPLYTMSNFSEQVGAGAGSIVINQCITDLWSAKLSVTTNPGATYSPDLSAIASCKDVKSSITFTAAGWSSNNRFLCDISSSLDGSTGKNSFTATFKSLDSKGNCN